MERLFKALRVPSGDKPPVRTKLRPSAQTEINTCIYRTIRLRFGDELHRFKRYTTAHLPMRTTRFPVCQSVLALFTRFWPVRNIMICANFHNRRTTEPNARFPRGRSCVSANNHIFHTLLFYLQCQIHISRDICSISKYTSVIYSSYFFRTC